MLTNSGVGGFLKRPFADVIDEVKRLRAENSHTVFTRREGEHIMAPHVNTRHDS